MTVIPPARASATAIEEVLTVSIAALTNGIFKGMFREKRVVTSA
ncbi:MAG: hypothetical protein BWY05_01387 [Euryarchaeota archaeon ADurb.Bin165]|nr:MAG: hypothetical protein BWY05_01387 [Euryarchaeota archaeon ADurb.Bin165]